MLPDINKKAYTERISGVSTQGAYAPKIRAFCLRNFSIFYAQLCCHQTCRPILWSWKCTRTFRGPGPRLGRL